MIITKLFEVESAHIVRNCTSHRCSHSIHGHSAKIEVSFEGSHLDNAGMIVDFGLLKGTVKEFIDSMDHCYLLCSKDDEEFKNNIKTTCYRWIELPFNPSAECLALFVHFFVNYIIRKTKFMNGEPSDLHVKSVRYWETRTGSATTTEEDLQTMWKPEWTNVVLSKGVTEDWSDALVGILARGEEVTNPVIPQQINLNPVQEPSVKVAELPVVAEEDNDENETEEEGTNE